MSNSKPRSAPSAAEPTSTGRSADEGSAIIVEESTGDEQRTAPEVRTVSEELPNGIVLETYY